MNDQTYNETRTLVGDHLAELLPFGRTKKELASELIRVERLEMENVGKILKLTRTENDEEIRLLRSFRRFKSLVKKTGEVFKWRTTPIDINILVVSSEDAIHISDPQEVQTYRP